MKKRILPLLLALLCAAALALAASAADAYTVRTIPAPTGDYAAFADIPVTVGAGGLVVDTDGKTATLAAPSTLTFSSFPSL